MDELQGEFIQRRVSFPPNPSPQNRHYTAGCNILWRSKLGMILPRIPNSAKSKAQDLVYPISHPGIMDLRRSVRFSLSQEIDELGEFYD